MKKNELLNKLEELNESLKSAELASLIEEIRPVGVSDGTKLHYFVTVNEQVLDPAVKYPRQMLTCYDILASALPIGEPVEREEVMRLIGEQADKLNTRQSPDRIYAFYQKRMEDEGWISRSTERI